MNNYYLILNIKIINHLLNIKLLYKYDFFLQIFNIILLYLYGLKLLKLKFNSLKKTSKIN